MNEQELFVSGNKTASNPMSGLRARPTAKVPPQLVKKILESIGSQTSCSLPIFNGTPKRPKLLGGLFNAYMQQAKFRSIG